MAKRKRKTLPRDFEERLGAAPLEDLQAVFETCELEATGGYSKRTALGFVTCPDALITWLVEQGADVNAADTYGDTPLHERASVRWTAQLPLLVRLGADVNRRNRSGQTPLHSAARGVKPEAAKVLLSHGADVHARDERGDVPLMFALRCTSNADLEDLAPFVEHLIQAGAEVTPEMVQEVERLGKQFEFHREDFNPDSVDAADAALLALYRRFGASPVPRRQVHDGHTPIQVPEGPMEAQHQALWELLVPSSGAAGTVQGEVIRISGRISQEIHGNGGANWDRDFKAMLAAFAAHLTSGVPLPPETLEEVHAVTETLRGGDGDEEALEQLCAFAIAWVRENPEPVKLTRPRYRR